MQQPKQFHLEFKWSAPLDPLMTKSNLLGVASDESEDGLSREHSLESDDQLLFSDTESVPSSNEGTATPKKTAFGEDEEWEVVPCSQPDDDMVSITWHTRNTWEYTGKKGGFGRKGYVACTGGYECIMHNACIGGLGNTSSLPIVMVNVVFETTPFWALGVYGRILKAPIPQYTAVYSGVYGRILGVYGRILGVFVCTMWLFQVEKFHCCAFCAHLVACFAFAQQLHTT